MATGTKGAGRKPRPSIGIATMTVRDMAPEDLGFKDLLIHYAQNTTMHGVPSIVGSQLYRGRHVFWMFLVAIMAMFLGTIVYWQMTDYYKYPTVTSTNIHYVTENDFPLITVCDLNTFHGYFMENLVDEYTAYHLTKLTEISGLFFRYSHEFFRKIPKPEPDNETDSTVYLHRLVTSVKAYLDHPKSNRLYCSWGQHYWDRCDASSAVVTEMGPCNTIDVRKMAKDRPPPFEADDQEEQDEETGHRAVSNALRGLTFYLDTSSRTIPYRFYQHQGFKIVLHDPDQFPLPKSNGFVVAANTTVEVEISKTVKIGLSPPFKAFGSGTCVDVNDEGFVNPLKRYHGYSKESCEKECFIQFVVTTCGGCRHFLHPGNEPLCPVDKLATCYREAQHKYYGGYTSNPNATSSSKAKAKAKKCHCPMPCRDVKFSAQLSSAPFVNTELLMELQDNYSRGGRIDHSWTYIRFYYADPVVTIIEQVPVYTAEGLLGAIGGQIGLFMGFSLITGAELLELLVLLIAHCRRSRGRSKNLEGEEGKGSEGL